MGSRGSRVDLRPLRSLAPLAPPPASPPARGRTRRNPPSGWHKNAGFTPASLIGGPNNAEITPARVRYVVGRERRRPRGPSRWP